MSFWRTGGGSFFLLTPRPDCTLIV